MKSFFRKYKTVLLFILVISLHFRVFIRHKPMEYYSDSYIYLDLAKNLDTRHAYQLTKGEENIYSFYPPVYSSFIVIMHRLFHTDYKASVDWISYLSLVLFIFFFYQITRLYFQKEKWRISLTVLVTFSLYPYFFIALSEHIFLALFMMQMYALLKWEKSLQKKLLFGAGILAGVMILTRYAAIGIAGAQLIWLTSLIYQRKLKFSNLLVFIAPVLLIYGGWHALLIANNTSTMGRKMLLHLPGKEHLKDLLKSFLNWLVPGATPYLFIPAVAGLAWLVFRYKNHLKDLLRQENIRIWWINLVVYLVFITLIIGFLDHSTSYDFRLLIPVYFSFVFILSKFLESILADTSDKIPGIFCALIVLSYSIHFVQFNLYSGPKVYSSELRELLQNNDKYIYTNTTDLLPGYVKNDTLILQIPFKYDPKTSLENKDFPQKTAEMYRQIENGEAVIMYFDGYEDWDFCPSKAEILQNLKAIHQLDFPEGSVIEKE